MNTLYFLANKKDVQISKCESNWQNAKKCNYYCVNIKIFEILKWQRVYSKGIYLSIKNGFFRQSVPLTFN